jgi:hypothetical protein
MRGHLLHWTFIQQGSPAAEIGLCRAMADFSVGPNRALIADTYKQRRRRFSSLERHACVMKPFLDIGISGSTNDPTNQPPRALETKFESPIPSLKASVIVGVFLQPFGYGLDLRLVHFYAVPR